MIVYKLYYGLVSLILFFDFFFFFSSRRRHTRCVSDWSSDVCSSDLNHQHEHSYEEHRSQVSGHFQRSAHSGSNSTLDDGFDVRLARCPFAEINGHDWPASANQINAVLPSTTPIGTGTVSVTFNGQTGPTTFPITVVATSFGVFADNASGTGPGTIMDASYQLLSPFHTVKPGVDYGILWGTGLDRK